MVLSVSGRSAILTIGAKGGLAEDASVTIRYGTADLTAKGFPVQISSVATVDEDDEDGLAIQGTLQGVRLISVNAMLAQYG